MSSVITPVIRSKQSLQPSEGPGEPRCSVTFMTKRLAGPAVSASTTACLFATETDRYQTLCHADQWLAAGHSPPKQQGLAYQGHTHSSQ